MAKRNGHARFTAIGIFTDWALLNLSFVLLYIARTHKIVLTSRYLNLLIAFNLVWLTVSLCTRKYRIHHYSRIREAIFTIAKSTMYVAYLLSIMVIVLGLFSFSRAHVFGTCLLYGTVQIFAYLTIAVKHTQSLKISGIQPSVAKLSPIYNISVRKFCADFFLVGIVFYVLNYLKRGTFTLAPSYDQASVICLWHLVCYVTLHREIHI